MRYMRCTLCLLWAYKESRAYTMAPGSIVKHPTSVVRVFWFSGPKIEKNIFFSIYKIMGLKLAWILQNSPIWKCIRRFFTSTYHLGPGGAELLPCTCFHVFPLANTLLSKISMIHTYHGGWCWGSSEGDNSTVEGCSYPSQRWFHKISIVVMSITVWVSLHVYCTHVRFTAHVHGSYTHVSGSVSLKPVKPHQYSNKIKKYWWLQNSKNTECSQFLGYLNTTKWRLRIRVDLGFFFFTGHEYSMGMYHQYHGIL